MANSSSQPSLGATFIPGGIDDYFLPTVAPVVSPLPQKALQDIIDQARGSMPVLERHNPECQPRSLSQTNLSMQQDMTSKKAGYSQESDEKKTYERRQRPVIERLPFPPLHNRTRNIPPSDAERETTLDNARIHVLRATDPEMQLTWAQDALSYIDIAMDYSDQPVNNEQSWRQLSDVQHQLLLDSMNIINFLADQQHPKADFLRGMWFEFGKFGVRPDKKEALACYHRAASKGYPRAHYRTGMIYETTNQPMLALRHFVAGEAQGDSASCFRMGMMSLFGQCSQTQDFNRAIHLLRHAANTADENSPQGAFIYGSLMAREIPQIEVPEVLLPWNVDSARMYIEKSAYLGFSKAQLKMGSAYELCNLGCDFNPVLSLHYNVLAARQSEPEAQLSISKWFLCGYQDTFPKNEQISYEYAERAARSGLALAEFAMGYYHEIGVFIPVNITVALEWYKKAASKGNKDAINRIEGISVASTLSRKDHEHIAVAKIKSKYGSLRGVRPTGQPTTFAMSTILQGVPKSLSKPQRAPYPVHDLIETIIPHHSARETQQRTSTPSGIGRPSSAMHGERVESTAYFVRTTQPSLIVFDKADCVVKRGTQPSPLPVSANISQARQEGMPPRHRLTTLERLPIPADQSTISEPVLEPQSHKLDIGFVAPSDPRFSENYIKPPTQSGDFSGRRLQKTAGDGRTASATSIAEGVVGQAVKAPFKGPQTFEAIGVAAVKKEGECAIM